MGRGKKGLFSKAFKQRLVFLGLALPLALLFYHTAQADFLATLGGDSSIDDKKDQSSNSQTMALLEPSSAPSSHYAMAGVIESGNALSPELAALGVGGAVGDFTPSTEEISVYVVKEGDTLSEIADMFGVSVNTIMWANDLSKSTAISEGDVLVILPVSGVRHKVEKGDTLAGIAKLYKADADEIARFNGLDEGAGLTRGEEIIVPHGEVSPPKPKPGVTKTPGASPSTAARYVGLPAYSGYYTRPLSGGVKTQGIHGNNGVDISAPVGTPLFASAGGTVIIARTGGWNGGYGNYVVIKHDNGTQTLYGHMNTVTVSPGQTVAQGAPLGTLGSTGNSTGPHVHFEIRGAKNPF